MTTIVAVETQDGVLWGWDSQTTSGYGTAQNDRSKVFRHGKYVIGVTGRVRDAQVIQSANLPKFDKKFKGDVQNWVIKHLVPAIRHALEKEGRLEVINSQAEYDSEFLVQVRDRVYKISGDFAVTRPVDAIQAVGSGGSYARGALLAGATPQKAVEIARKCDVYTGGEVWSAFDREVK